MNNADRNAPETEKFGEQSLGQLVAEILRDLQFLVKSEISLAKAEINQNIADLRNNIGVVAGGGLLAFAGLIIFLEGLAAVLALWMPAWAAFLGVGLMTGVVAMAVIKIALRRLAVSPIKPVSTVESVKQDIQTIEEYI